MLNGNQPTSAHFDIESNGVILRTQRAFISYPFLLRSNEPARKRHEEQVNLYNGNFILSYEVEAREFVLVGKAFRNLIDLQATHKIDIHELISLN